VEEVIPTQAIPIRDLVKCRVCGAVVPIDGPNGLFRHIVLEHRDSEWARQIFLILAREALPPARA
jgi:hypothetical protein